MNNRDHSHSASLSLDCVQCADTATPKLSLCAKMLNNKNKAVGKKKSQKKQKNEMKEMERNEERKAGPTSHTHTHNEEKQTQNDASILVSLLYAHTYHILLKQKKKCKQFCKQWQEPWIQT